MISLVLSCAFGITFGYFLVGPVNRSYKAHEFGLLIMFLAFMFGFGLFMALTLATVIERRTVTELPNLLLALGFWATYSASAGLGAYVHQRHNPPAAVA